jgi:hypothetical protein
MKRVTGFSYLYRLIKLQNKGIKAKQLLKEVEKELGKLRRTV